MKKGFDGWFTVGHAVAVAGTTGHLFINDLPILNAWNWIWLLPLDILLGIVWPLYWFAVHDHL